MKEMSILDILQSHFKDPEITRFWSGITKIGRSLLYRAESRQSGMSGSSVVVG